jgi:selenocysteine lyase/cysteine desulfurase
MTESIEERWSKAQALSDRLFSILRGASLGDVIGHADRAAGVPVASLAVSRMPCSELASILDSSFHIEVRSGLHCSALIHHYLGTQALGGTLRFSLGHTTLQSDLDYLEEACRELDNKLGG